MILPKVVNLRLLTTPGISNLERLFSATPRLQGYYLLKLLALEPALEDLRDETVLDQIFEMLDDRPWQRLPGHVSDQSWADYRAEASAARDEVIGALIGGGCVGHAHYTMEPSLAETVWSLFESQFSLPRDYYTGIQFGSPAYVFQRGAAIISRAAAGILFVIEDD